MTFASVVDARRTTRLRLRGLGDQPKHSQVWHVYMHWGGGNEVNGLAIHSSPR